jgi:hypothetical protein
MTIKHLSISLALTALLGVSGCSDPTAELQEMPNTASKKVKEDYTPSAIAGIQKDLTKSQDPNRLKGLIAATSRFGRRQNPFALATDEIAFDRLQASERLLSEEGNMGTKFELPEDKTPTVVAEEPQPYRRLSGVVIGDAVYALLEEGNTTTIIRPGMRLANSDWRVASIDKDRAVLVRDGDRMPKEVEVRLEYAPPGMGGGAAGGGGGQQGGGGRAGGGRAGGGGGPSGFSGA